MARKGLYCRNFKKSARVGDDTIRWNVSLSAIDDTDTALDSSILRTPSLNSLDPQVNLEDVTWKSSSEFKPLLTPLSSSHPNSFFERNPAIKSKLANVLSGPLNARYLIPKLSYLWSCHICAYYFVNYRWNGRTSTSPQITNLSRSLGHRGQESVTFVPPLTLEAPMENSGCGDIKYNFTSRD
jgi:hypothetical protein